MARLPLAGLLRLNDDYDDGCDVTCNSLIPIFLKKIQEYQFHIIIVLRLKTPPMKVNWGVLIIKSTRLLNEYYPYFNLINTLSCFCPSMTINIHSDYTEIDSVNVI